jgi:nicotinate-nucleotide adenylyltransferase
VGGRILSGERWGVLGGTFDPVHVAHLALAEQVRDALDLRAVLFVPAARPVHKPAAGVSPVEHRLRMVELAIADNPAFQISRIEIDRPSPSYSVDTIEQLVAERPADSFVFIVSAEAVRELLGWRRPQRLLELCEVAVVPRLGVTTPDRRWLNDKFPGQAERFIFIDGSHLGHSSSEIRARVAAGRTIRYLVPSQVEAYIREHALYEAND